MKIECYECSTPLDPDGDIYSITGGDAMTESCNIRAWIIRFKSLPISESVIYCGLEEDAHDTACFIQIENSIKGTWTIEEVPQGKYRYVFASNR